MKILFITRKYPPSIGGMQKFSADFYTTFKDHCTLLALGRSQIHLLWWLPCAFVKGVWLARTVEVIHLGDGVLAWLGVLLHWCTGKPISITLHGLDVTYTKFGYQKFIWLALKQYQAIVCVSSATAKIVQQHGLTSIIIPNGIFLRNQNVPVVKKTPTDKIILLTVGRLVPRKGVAWFIEQVMPKLPKNFSYTVIGTGPEHQLIQDLISQLQLGERVQLLGKVSDDCVQHWYHQADIFIMPNITVVNDIEGFGIVALEAAACGLPVLAANVEGIRDAVVDGGSGFMVESGDAAAWKHAIETLMTQINAVIPLMNAESIQQTVREKFSWEKIKQEYLKVFNNLLK